MSATQESEALASGLQRVGFKANQAVEIAVGSIAEVWSSDYAELFVIDAESTKSVEIPELLKRIDGVVAARLRQQRDAGRFIDAHVCVLFPAEIIRSDELSRESEASRYVSRKYWIDRSSPVDEILRRVTLMWVDVESSSPGVPPEFLQEYASLRERIAARMGAGAAADFIEAKSE